MNPSNSFLIDVVRRCSYCELVKFLSYGADVNMRDSKGATALHYAAAEGKLSAAILLLKHGADVDLADNSGNTPLHWAVWSGNLPIVEELERSGADFYRSNTHGTSPAKELYAMLVLYLPFAPDLAASIHSLLKRAEKRKH
jgi:ankyrin repeat protein